MLKFHSIERTGAETRSWYVHRIKVRSGVRANTGPDEHTALQNVPSMHTERKFRAGVPALLRSPELCVLSIEAARSCPGHESLGSWISRGMEVPGIWLDGIRALAQWNSNEFTYAQQQEVPAPSSDLAGYRTCSGISI